MSIFAVAILAVLGVVILGLVVVLADEYSDRFGPVETHTISTRELPNVGAADTERART